MKIGDLVRFSKEHTSSPGLEYCFGWLGVLLEVSGEKVKINWFRGVRPEWGISEYDDEWRDGLPYPPFEVVSENR